MTRFLSAMRAERERVLINLALVVLGVALVALYRAGLHAHSPKEIGWFTRLALIQGALYTLAAWLTLRARPARSTLIIALVFAALFQLSILFAPRYLSDDIYRYIWDGRVQAAGINPYRYIPADESLTRLRDEAIYPHINRRDYAPTIYPPVAEIIFLLTTRISESVTWMKATMVAFEAVACWALLTLLASFGYPRQRILIYAWHPLVVWEFAGSGHLDAIAVAFIALALVAYRRDRQLTTGCALACATLVKLFPLALLPALWRRGSWRTPAAFALTVLVCYAPYLSVGVRGVLGFLPGYAAEQGMQSGWRYYLLAVARKLFGAGEVPTALFLVCALMLLAGLALWVFVRKEARADVYVRGALLLAASFTVLLSPHFPWYFAWLVPFLCLVPCAPVFYLTVASFVLYWTWIGDSPDQLFIINSCLYPPCFLLAAFAWWTRRSRLWSITRRTNNANAPVASAHATDAAISTMSHVSVVIPAHNEEETIAEVVRAVPRHIASEVIVVDNDSADRTAERALEAGARVVRETRRGYGSACYAGLRSVAPDCEIVVFLDGDGSDYPEELGRLVAPILRGTHDFVISSRLRGRREPGSMYFTQVLAGHMTGLLLRFIYGVRYTDMGPFRAIRRSALEQLGMREMTYGWPLEMQMRAARARLRMLEVPVNYRRRAGGASKISGTVRGTFKAAARILFTLARIAVSD